MEEFRRERNIFIKIVVKHVKMYLLQKKYGKMTEMLNISRSDNILITLGDLNKHKHYPGENTRVNGTKL